MSSREKDGFEPTKQHNNNNNNLMFIKLWVDLVIVKQSVRVFTIIIVKRTTITKGNYIICSK